MPSERPGTRLSARDVDANDFAKIEGQGVAAGSSDFHEFDGL